MQDSAATESRRLNERDVSPADIDHYRANGYVCLSAVATQEEIKTFRPVIENVVRATTESRDTQGRLDDYSKMFQQVTNAWRLDRRVEEFVLARKFGRIAARLMGVKGVRLYHDQALFKPPGGERTYWHQDMFYWPLDTDRTITMWMPLVDVDAGMGTMIFACGSHRDGLVSASPISESAGEFVGKVVKEKGYECRSHVLKAGDATFHSGYTIHSAYPNKSESTREVMTVIYYADGTRLLERPNEYQVVDMNVFLPGTRPGDPAVSPLNPIVYEETIAV